MDKNGFIDIKSLLGDSSLKLNLIEAVDYGEKINSIFKDNSHRDLKENYNSHITTMIPSDSFQLVKMLDAKRIDYIISKLITSEHFRKAQIDPSHFQLITFDQTPVNSVEDPNLETYSVKCNKHPLSYKVINTLNNLIRQKRYGTRELVENMRTKMEPSYKRQVYFYETFQMRFSNSIFNNSIDWWYKDFQKVLGEDISSYGLLSQSSRNSDIIKTKKPVARLRQTLYVSLKDLENRTLYILRKPTILSAQKHPRYPRTYPDYPYLPTRTIETFTTIEMNFLWRQKSNILEELTLSEILGNVSPDGINRIVVETLPMNRGDVSNILLKFRKVYGIKFLSPSIASSKEIVDNLPSYITEFSVIDGYLKNINLYEKLKKYKLEVFDVKASDLDKGDVDRILVDHHKTLKHIDLSFNVRDLSPNFINLLGGKNFPNLSWISLHNMLFNPSSIHLIYPLLSESVHYLDLSGNSLLPVDFREITRLTPRLKMLRTGSLNGEFILISKNMAPIKLPESLEELELMDSKIRTEDLPNLILPKRLKAIDLSGNQIGNGGFKYLKKALAAHSPVKLILDEVNTNEEEMIDFLKSISLQELKFFSCGGCRLGNNFLMFLAQSATQIERLELSSNLITDFGVNWLEKFIKLKHLDISGNFLGAASITKILSFLPNTLEYLNVSQVLGFPEGGYHFPQSLNQLTISNSLTKEALPYFLTQLPKQLTTLFLSGVELQNKDLQILSSFMPPHIDNIYIPWINWQGSSFQDLFSSLPNTMINLEINGCKGKNITKKIKFSPPNVIAMLRSGDCDFFSYDNILVNMISQKSRSLNLNNPQIKAETLKVLLEKMNNNEFINFSSNLNLEKLLSENELPSKLIFNRLKSFGFSQNGKEIFRFLDGRYPDVYYFTLFSSKKLGLDPQFVDRYKSQRVRLTNIETSGQFINKEFGELLLKMDLSQVTFLTLPGATIPHEIIFKILKKINPYPYLVNLRSTNLTEQHIDQLLESMPKRVLRLNLGGNRFGYEGIKKIRKWVEDREKEVGYPIELVE